MSLVGHVNSVKSILLTQFLYLFKILHSKISLYLWQAKQPRLHKTHLQKSKTNGVLSNLWCLVHWCFCNDQPQKLDLFNSDLFFYYCQRRHYITTQLPSLSAITTPVDRIMSLSPFTKGLISKLHYIMFQKYLCENNVKEHGSRTWAYSLLYTACTQLYQ